MIKRFLTTIGMIAMTLTCMANNVISGNYINFEIYYTTPKDKIVHRPKSPIKLPTVYLENNILYFESSLDNYVLQIISAEDEETIIYSGIISPGETTYQLPIGITGEYILKLNHGEYIFSGYIEL